MKKVRRDEILGLGAYEEIRERYRRRMFGVKADRRVHVGPLVTVLFENHDTVLYQVQEMLRTERITAEPDIAHEIDTYNDLLPAGRGVGGTLMIEEPDAAKRPALLQSLVGLHDHVFLRVGDTRLSARWIRHEADESEQISSVQYFAFDLGEHVTDLASATSVSLEIDHPAYTHSADLAPNVVRALDADLRS
ncbi:MAG: DUF3501 family protein [Deltaproteobacteria bacterium]|nr:DUF3501 family protein [Deltaproteobacteria bacterium]